AAELYITTGKAAYKKALSESKWHGMVRATVDGTPKKEGATFTSMAWREVDTLGKISLAIVPSGLTQTQKRYQQEIAKVADEYLALEAKQGYRQPLAPDAEGKYPWGSNSLILNNMLMLALANDFTSEVKYRNGVSLGMDYLLGRNAMA